MSRTLQQVIVWTLVLLTAAPPAVLAEVAGGASPIPVPYGVMPGQMQVLPGQPIVTNPTALQPITPNQAPCPNPVGGGGAITPPSPVQSGGSMEQQAALGLMPGQPAPG